MKALIINFGLSIFSLTFFTACNSGETNKNATEQTEIRQEVSGVTYTCSMHPEVISQEPGKCPKCGMNLVKVKTDEQQPAASEQH